MNTLNVSKTIEHFFSNAQFALGFFRDGKRETKGWKKTLDDVLEVDNAFAVFEIGSITKVFTAYLLAQMVKDDILALEDKISTYLPLPFFQKSGITFLHLATHTSGLPRLPSNFYSIEKHDSSDPYLNYNEAALLAFLREDVILESKPGEKFLYSNLGLGLLGYVLSKIGQVPFVELIREKIFLPLGMMDSHFKVSDTGAKIVQGYNEEGQATSNWHGGVLAGCIGAFSTSYDLLLFMQHMLEENNEVAALALQTHFTIEDNYHIGLAWGIRHRGKFTYNNHGGGSIGYSGYLRLNRKNKTGLILLTNVSAFYPEQKNIEQLSLELMDSLQFPS